MKILKISLFQATVESILLYGTETWTIPAALSKKIDGCYTRMLRMALNVRWYDKVSNKDLYGDIPNITDVIQKRRMRLAGHLQRHDDIIAHDLLFKQPLTSLDVTSAVSLEFLWYFSLEMASQVSLEVTSH